MLLLEPGKSASPEALQFAADVAAYFSQSKDSTQVAVGYCNPKHLRRPPGQSKPGLVSVSQTLGTVYGRPDRGRQYADLLGPKDDAV